jgi:hypothetical protein
MLKHLEEGDDINCSIQVSKAGDPVLHSMALTARGGGHSW